MRLERRGEADGSCDGGRAAEQGVLAPAQRGEQGGFDVVAVGGLFWKSAGEQGVAGGATTFSGADAGYSRRDRT